MFVVHTCTDLATYRSETAKDKLHLTLVAFALHCVGEMNLAGKIVVHTGLQLGGFFAFVVASLAKHHSLVCNVALFWSC